MLDWLTGIGRAGMMAMGNCVGGRGRGAIPSMSYSESDASRREDRITD